MFQLSSALHNFTFHANRPANQPYNLCVGGNTADERPSRTRDLSTFVNLIRVVWRPSSAAMMTTYVIRETVNVCLVSKMIILFLRYAYYANN